MSALSQRACISYPTGGRVRRQLFLGSLDFLEQIKRLVRRHPVANVPGVRTRPTRLAADDVLRQVADTYRFSVKTIINRITPRCLPHSRVSASTPGE